MQKQQQRTRQHQLQAQAQEQQQQQQQQQQQLQHSTKHVVRTPWTLLPAINHRQQGWEQQRNSHSSSNMQQQLLPSETCLTAASGHQQSRSLHIY
jgi:hypothetical protein